MPRPRLREKKSKPPSCLDETSTYWKVKVGVLIEEQFRVVFILLRTYALWFSFIAESDIHDQPSNCEEESNSMNVFLQLGDALIDEPLMELSTELEATDNAPIRLTILNRNQVPDHISVKGELSRGVTFLWICR